MTVYICEAYYGRQGKINGTAYHAAANYYDPYGADSAKQQTREPVMDTTPFTHDDSPSQEIFSSVSMIADEAYAVYNR